MYTTNRISAESKREFYQLLAKQLDSLLTGEQDLIANMANASALLFDQLEGINWAGFYLNRGGELVLGPFQGKPACVRIAFGRGVCGTAAATKTANVVVDVHEFPGHIACDPHSRSEIVLPIVVHNEFIGVLDIDSPHIGRFTTEDQVGLEEFLRILEKHTQFASF